MDAVITLFGEDHVTLKGLDISKVKYIHLLVVTLDSIGGVLGMSPLLESLIPEMGVDLDGIRATYEIRPMACIDIESLEESAIHFESESLPLLLERWFQVNPSLATPLGAMSLFPEVDEEHRFAHLFSDGWEFLFNDAVHLLFPAVSDEELKKRKAESRSRLPMSSPWRGRYVQR